ncbi:MAG: hypothetical protein HC915_08340 [Anaerolineae bacterium]|nr:hypothetical protein [Anaerolineae bacterium]
MQTFPFHASSVNEVHQRLTELPQRPHFAIVFASIVHDLSALQAVFVQAGVPLLGASSSGEILVTGAEDPVYAEHIVVMPCVMQHPAAFVVRGFDGSGADAAALGQQVGRWAGASFAQPALLLVSAGLTTDGEQVLRGVEAVLGTEVPVFGGLAGDDLRMQQPLVFDQHHIYPNGAVALALDRSIVQVSGVASSGWRAVGREMVVDRAKGNVVYTLDDKPALDIYQEYLGVNANTSTSITAEYPLQIVRPKGYSVLRASMVINPADRSIIYAGSVPQGARVRFCVPPGMEIIDHALSEIRAFRDSAPQAEALVLFSCKGRHNALGPMAEDEIKPMQQLWGAPLIGFYTYGEIGRGLDQSSDFHNNTCVLVTLGERMPTEGATE